MHKSKSRQMRKDLKTAKRKAAEYAKNAEGTSGVIRAHKQKAADEQRHLAQSLAHQLSTRS